MELESFELVLLRQPARPAQYDEATLDRIQREHLAYHATLTVSGGIVTNGLRPIRRCGRDASRSKRCTGFARRAPCGFMGARSASTTTEVAQLSASVPHLRSIRGLWRGDAHNEGSIAVSAHTHDALLTREGF